MSWALIAHSAIDGPTGGILAGSKDINDIIESGRISDLFIFPHETSNGGIYLWRGKVTDRGECGVDAKGGSERIASIKLDHYISFNKKELP